MAVPVALEEEDESDSDWRASELSRRVWWRLERRSIIEMCFSWRFGSRGSFEVASTSSSFSIVVCVCEKREERLEKERNRSGLNFSVQLFKRRRFLRFSLGNGE